jgi:hypothetical protein
MPDEAPTPAEIKPTVAAPTVAPLTPAPKPAAKKIYAPAAMDFGVKLRETTSKLLVEWNPEQVDPVYLAIVKESAQKHIEAGPSQFNGCELKIEVGSHGIGARSMILVNWHNL